MKYLIIVPDGMTDHGIGDADGGATSLALARTPNLDRALAVGRVALTNNIPSGFSIESGVANMSILGFDAARYYSGRAPIEALGLQVALAPNDLVFRCNLVTLDARELPEGRVTITDFTGGCTVAEVDTQRQIARLNSMPRPRDTEFVHGREYAHLFIWRDCPLGEMALPYPHENEGVPLPLAGLSYTGDGLDADYYFPADLIRASLAALDPEHLASPAAAPAIWLWGDGRQRETPSFKTHYGMEGTVISAMNIIRGTGAALGLAVAPLQRATGHLDTDVQEKTGAALTALRRQQLAFLHLEAPDAVSHRKDPDLKRQAIEWFDREVLGTLFARLPLLGEDVTIMLAVDHPTSPVSGRHLGGAVPALVFRLSSLPATGGADAGHFCEATLAAAATPVPTGKLVDWMLNHG